jgi:uncharacterized metal-binding protein
MLWIEHSISAAQDTVPRLPPPFHFLKIPFSALSKSRGLSHQEIAVQIGKISNLLFVEMLDILTELSVLAVSLTANFALRISWNDPNFLGFAFYPTLHKLLSI